MRTKIVIEKLICPFMRTVMQDLQERDPVPKNVTGPTHFQQFQSNSTIKAPIPWSRITPDPNSGPDQDQVLNLDLFGPTAANQLKPKTQYISILSPAMQVPRIKNAWRKERK